jgi:hypothetical protein
LKVSKLTRYALSNLEGGVHEACWIDLLCWKQSFKYIDMCLIGFTYCITCLFGFLDAKSGNKEARHFLLMKG